MPSIVLNVVPSVAISERAPGSVIAHYPQKAGIYIGSPSIAVLPDGDYVSSHDEFGPKSTQNSRAVSHIFRSADRGQTWKRLATISGAFWSTLFVHRGALYLLGTDKEYGNAVIRRSLDGGATWTEPATATSGLLRGDGEYHCAPMPIVEHNARLWRAMEWRNPGKGWGINFRAGMMSVPVDVDLLNAANWTVSNFLPSDRSWNGGDMGAWLEGNAVVTSDGKIVNVLRVDTRSPDEKAALVSISDDGKVATFNPTSGFIDFPGGAKKFTIRYDQKTRFYWSLATVVHERHRDRNPGGIRNTLALTSSPDLKNWTVRCILLYHPDTARHGFQYVDWLFEGDDLIAVCRTAYDDGQGGARNNHDANYLTFHRFANFRRLTMADSVPMPEPISARYETHEFIITGQGFELAKLADGEQAFSNRDYIWRDVPMAFHNGRITRTSGGERAKISVQAKRAGTLSVATALSQPGVKLEGWQATEVTFHYTDAGKTTLTVFTRHVQAGEETILPQGNWTGTLLLLPDAPATREKGAS